MKTSVSWTKPNRFCLFMKKYPHEETVPPCDFHWDKYSVIARWTSDFDCKEETQFWYCIKDDAFDIDSLKAKRRYEIKKGNKNFYTKVINPYDFADELYRVYETSFTGYKNNVRYKTKEEFQDTLKAWSQKDAVLFGCFNRLTDELVGFSDVYTYGRYLPISSLKTCPSEEKAGVNFALVYGIIEYFTDSINQGCYLCDGARNVLHETNFQDFLIKYFGFRRAYCKLHLKYRRPFDFAVSALFPLRNKLKKFGAVYTILKQEAWARGLNE